MSALVPYTVRDVVPDDWQRVMAVMVEWWGGRDLREMLPWVFFEHFRTTSLIAEHEEELVGFLVGFLCPTHADEAYVHFAGVHPAWRRVGLARDLYRRFCAMAQAEGRTMVRAVTSPVNKDSIAFHQRLGFVLMPGNGEVDGLPVTLDRAGPAQHRVCLELRLEGVAALDTAPSAAADSPAAGGVPA
jgi:ribosomal protein S18 acetylase RimI-like enzyme